MLDLPSLGHCFTADHEQVRAPLREVVSREITPLAIEWDEAGVFARSVHRRAAELGATGMGYPEEYGGTPNEIFYRILLAEEYARCGAGGVQASMNSHTLAPPPVLAAGSESLKRRVSVATGAARREDRRTRRDRAFGWLGRGGSEDHRRARRRQLHHRCLVGAENQGFKILMNNFDAERPFLSTLSYRFAQVELWLGMAQCFAGPTANGPAPGVPRGSY